MTEKIERIADQGEGRVRVLWLTPDKPTNISVGRRRIAEHLDVAGIDVTLRGTTPRTTLRSLRERGEYDVVVGTTRAGALAGAAFAVFTQTPLIVDHVDPIRQFTATNPRPLTLAVRLAENVAFALADHVFYVYDEEERRVRRYAQRATKTDLGVAYKQFADPDPAVVERARKRLRREGAIDARVLIYVGGLEPLYHVRELLACVEYLPGWTIVVAGTGSLAGVVERTARERGDVCFLGTVSHETIPGYLHAADVGACLVDDPHTLKVLEYAAAGLPVVQLRGWTEARLGDLVEYCSSDPADIARATRRAFQRDYENAAALRAFARQYRWSTIVETYALAITTSK
jgi:glycosyltransferase involved in cell wall biosynthesis